MRLDYTRILPPLGIFFKVKTMTDTTDLLTIRDFLRYAVSRFQEAKIFYGHGTANAADEALSLIFHTLHLPHDTQSALLDARLTKSEREALTHLIERRVKDRIPVPYLTHEAWFAGLSFYVDERVLIPRSPIAELIEQHFNPWIHSDEVHDILDLCTGSGCIAIACAQYFPDALVDATDISQDALAVAKKNILRHEMEDQIHLFESDLFNLLPNKKYDIIVSNPPYVDAEEMKILPEEYHHEPKTGLAAGPLGLDFVERILKEAPRFLKPDGILIVEVGNSEFALAEKYPEVPFTWLEFERGGGGVFLLTRKQLVSSDLVSQEK